MKKDNSTIALNVLYFEKWIYVLPTFQNKTPITKKSSCFNNSKKGNGEEWNYLAVKNLSALLGEEQQKLYFFFRNVFIPL